MKLSKKPVYKSILLKLSGEAMMGSQDHGIDAEICASFASQIKDVCDLGVKVAVVVGGGFAPGLLFFAPGFNFAQYIRPAAGSGISGAGTIGKQFDVRDLRIAFRGHSAVLPRDRMNVTR